MTGQTGKRFSTAPAVTCMKILLTVFNFIFWTAGLAILALGIWMKVQLHQYMEMTTVYDSTAGWVMIGVGAGIVLITSLGCCCTFKGASYLLYIYSAFLVLLFICDLTVSISAFVYKSKVEDGFRTGLYDSMKMYANDTKKKESIDSLQQSLQCCGNSSYTDWYSISWDGQSASQHVPDSCYGDVNNKDATLYKDGCYTKVSSFMKNNFIIIGGVAIGFSFLELFGAILACCLAKNINKAKYEQVA